jgi:ketosteroid isomerase-like protein
MSCVPSSHSPVVHTAVRSGAHSGTTRGNGHPAGQNALVFRVELRYTDAMKSLVFVMLLALATPAVASAADPADEKAVMATLEAVATATIHKDVATLAKIYGDDVTYAHSSGATENKTQVLAGIRGQYIEGTFMKFSGTTIRVYGDVALAKGVVDFRSGATGTVIDNHLNILWVLVRRAQGPHGWQIVARQTTRIGPSNGTPVK